MKDLRRGESQLQSARNLNIELGGSPLAISHITGYARRLNLGADQVLQTIQQKRKVSSDVWHARGGSIYYQKPLDAVWDLALRNLKKTAIDILDVLAFLHPDAVEESLLVGGSNTLGLGEDEVIRTSR